MLTKNTLTPDLDVQRSGILVYQGGTKKDFVMTHLHILRALLRVLSSVLVEHSETAG